MSLLLELELALHDADCPGHGPDFKGHGEKYSKMAKAVAAILPPEREPWWLKDRKLIQESSLDLILNKLDIITKQVGA